MTTNNAKPGTLPKGTGSPTKHDPYEQIACIATGTTGAAPGSTVHIMRKDLDVSIENGAVKDPLAVDDASPAADDA